MNKDNVIAKGRKSKIEIVPGEHFLIRLIQHQLSLGGIGALQGELCQIKLGNRVGVLCNGVILIAERKKEDTAVLVTGWNASKEQQRQIQNNEQISVGLGKGSSEMMLIAN